MSFYKRLLLIVLLTCPSLSWAMVQSIEIKNRQVLPAYNDIPATEKLSGIAHFSFQVGNPYNSQIVDLNKAPMNAGQTVTAKANFMVLQPLNPDKRSGTALLEVSNRGGKAALRYFNLARSNANPQSPADLGDGFIQRQGLTLIWIGWQYDVAKEGSNLYAEIPRTLRNHQIKGLVRSDWVVDMPTKTLKLGHRSMPTKYLLDSAGSQKAYLTRRKSRNGERELVPTSNYRFSGGDIVASSQFEANYIYELVYPSKDPYIAGIGSAIVRDMMSYAKYNKAAKFKVNKGIAFGVSQTGRFLRNFIYQGFNVAEDGRTVFDGMMIHTAGAGRGSFNHRFAQPSRDAHRFSAFFYPTDIFPFSSAVQTHPITGEQEGLLSHQAQNHQPKIFYTNTGYEYWGRAASLIHTDLNGKKDLPLQSNERLYHFASSQHFQMSLDRLQPQPGANRQYRGNSLNFFYYLRSLLGSMNKWVKEGEQPPESVYPKLSDGSLTHLSNYKLPIAGITTPAPHLAYMADYGNRWKQGIVDHQPPKLVAHWTPLVPAIDEFGNEKGGIRHPLIRVPTATFLPWNKRGSGFQAEELKDFYGTMIPFDSDMLYQMYRNKTDYMQRIAHAANGQYNNGYMLQEDVDKVVQEASALWDWVKANN